MSGGKMERWMSGSRMERGMDGWWWGLRDGWVVTGWKEDGWCGMKRWMSGGRIERWMVGSGWRDRWVGEGREEGKRMKKGRKEKNTSTRKKVRRSGRIKWKKKKWKRKERW